MWTKKALERIGLKVVEAGKQEHIITVKKKDGAIQLNLKTRNKTIEFDSIYQLSLFLKSIFRRKLP